MTAALFLLAAGAGAIGRFVVGRVVCSWQALLVVNTGGAGLLGWMLASDLDGPTITIIGSGFCGTLTTYSSFALEARELGSTWGGLYAAVTVGCACGAAAIGASW